MHGRPRGVSLAPDARGHYASTIVRVCCRTRMWRVTCRRLPGRTRGTVVKTWRGDSARGEAMTRPVNHRERIEGWLRDALAMRGAQVGFVRTPGGARVEGAPGP